MVLVSTADKRKIYDYLLSEGVFCSKKVTQFFQVQLANNAPIKNRNKFVTKRNELSNNI
jgi:hypothetical protein